MNPKKWLSGLFAFALVAFAAGCGGGSMNRPVQPQPGTVFVAGTDAPLPSVVSFQGDITGLSVAEGANPAVSVLSGTQTVDFARLRSVLPSGTGFTPGQISTINLTGNEMYFIYWMHNSFANFFFNSSLLVAGQHVSIGGPFTNGAATVKRVVLRHEGQTGT